MKRHIVTTIALLLCFCLLLAPAAAEQSADNILYGDVDGSGKIDTGDALKALQWTVGLTGLTAGQRLLGDVSADGLVNATDALYILQYTVELINRFRAQEQSFALNPYTSQLSDRSGAPAKALEGIVTTFQMGAQYNGLYELPADSVMVYIDSLGAVAAAFDSWKENQGGIRVDYMIPAGRDNGEYLTLYPDRADKDSHSNQAGEFHLHPGGVRYMMPTPSYMEYKWDVIEQCLERGPGAIVLEEPETFNLYCYADGFKEAWDDYYGTPFADPAESAENRYQANKLFAHMWSVFLDEIGRRIEESHPEVDFIVATHSIASYGSWDMTSSISDYTQSPYIDGIIGQTWSDAVNVPVPYGGGSESRPFENSYFDYATYVCAMDGKELYTLNDAASDNNYDWELRRELWHATLVAQLLQPEVRKFQSFIWPDRSIGKSPADYRTEQLQAYTMLRNIGEYESKLYAGTQGISLAVSDSYSYHRLTDGQTIAQAFYGLSIPLVERGIPLGAVCLDKLESADDLAGVKVLLLTYDVMKPLKEETNQALADWVRQGGVLLYLGGQDSCGDVNTEWWGKQGETPFDDLIAKLGVDLQPIPNDLMADLTWVGPDGFGSSIQELFVPFGVTDTSYRYEGSGYTTLLDGMAGAMGVEYAVGEGHFLSVGLSSTYFGMAEEGPQVLRELVSYAVSRAGTTYLESDLMMIQRGPFIAAQAMRGGEEQVLRGDFIDLFDPAMTVKTEVTLAPGESALLYDLSEERKGEVPRLAHTGVTLQGEATETADQTVFTFIGPDNSLSSTRLTGNGKFPASVTATMDGKPYQEILFQWENASQSLLVQTNNVSSHPITVTVEWTDQPREDDPVQRYREMLVTADSNGQDEEYIVRNSGLVYDRRYCDGNAELVYRIDLSEYDDPVVVLNVASNYLISVSDHDGGWTEAYNYKTLSGGKWIEGISNRTAHTIRPSDYGLDDVVYVKLSSCDPSKGWGGCIYSFSIRYLETIA